MLRAHRRHVRRELRRLGDDRRVEVADRQPAAAHEADDVAQQRAAVGALPARIGVGEVRAEVAQRERAQQRVADRVQQHVGVASGRQAALVRNVDAAQDQRPAGDQRVHVEAVADAESHAAFLLRREDRRGEREVVRER